MNAITFFITLLVLAAGASADQCTASASAAPRRGSAPWTSNGVTYTIYDITIVNTGSCDIKTLSAYFGYPAGNTIASTFNYESTSGAISGFGDSIASGATYNGAGFILAGSGTPTSAFIRPFCSCPTVASTPTPRAAPTVAATPAPSAAPVSPTARPILATVRPTDAPSSSNCFQSCSADEVCAALDVSGYSCHPRECKNLDCGSNVCINDGGVARCIISATLAPTTAPVPVATSAPATSAPVATPAPTGSATCSVSMSLVPRANGEFNDANGVANKMWDLVFTNKGASAVSGLQITFTAGTTVAQKWNLAQVGSSLTYDVLTYGALNTNGAEYHGSGFVISGSKAAPSIAVVATCA